MGWPLDPEKYERVMRAAAQYRIEALRGVKRVVTRHYNRRASVRGRDAAILVHDALPDAEVVFAHGAE